MKIKFKDKHKCKLWVTHTFTHDHLSNYWNIVLNNIGDSDNIIDAIIAEYILKHNLKFKYNP